MGTIKKQTIQGSFFSYLGVVIGYLNIAILMPRFFSTEEIGLTQIILSITAIFSMLGTLGFNGVSNRLFPLFRNASKKHNGYPFLLSITGLLGFFIIVAAFFFLKPYIIESNIDKSPLLIDFIFLLMPITFFRIFFLLLDGYSKIMLDAITGTFWMNFGYKAFNLVFIVLYALHMINFQQYMFGFTFALCFPPFPILFKLIRKRQFSIGPQLKFINKSLFIQILTVSFFSLLVTSSGVIVNNIDRIMINKYLSLSTTGIFSVCALFGNIILIPFIAMNKISIPILAEANKINDNAEIDNIYYKSTITQIVFASLILVGIAGNIDNIFRILPPEYILGKPVVILYSIAYLIHTFSGVSGSILGISSYYKVVTYFMFFTIIFTIIFNIIFIPILGMEGAALATILTFICSSLFKILYLKYKMNLFPYTYKHLLILVFAIVSYIPCVFIQQFDSLILDIGIRSLLISIIFGTLILIFNISEEITDIYINSKRKILNIISKH